MTTNSEHLQWMYDRMVNIHNERPNIDYMRRFQEIINEIQAAEAMEATLKKSMAGISPFQAAMKSMEAAIEALNAAAQKFGEVQANETCNGAERSMSMMFKKTCIEALKSFGLRPSSAAGDNRLVIDDPYSANGLNPPRGDD